MLRTRPTNFWRCTRVEASILGTFVSNWPELKLGMILTVGAQKRGITNARQNGDSQVQMAILVPETIPVGVVIHSTIGLIASTRQSCRVSKQSRCG